LSSDRRSELAEATEEASVPPVKPPTPASPMTSKSRMGSRAATHTGIALAFVEPASESVSFEVTSVKSNTSRISNAVQEQLGLKPGRTRSGPGSCDRQRPAANGGLIPAPYPRYWTRPWALGLTP